MGVRGRPPGSKNKEVPAAPDILVIPRRIKKEIGTLSLASGVSPAQVLVDILDGGLINAREMYRTLIEYRKSLREQLDATETEVLPEANGSEPTGENGSCGDGLGREAMVGAEHELPGSDIGLDLAAVGPGLSAEGDEALNGDRGDAS